jgi:hypothetical protein
MHRNVTAAAKHNHVLIFVIPIRANGALGIFLGHQSSLLHAQILLPTGRQGHVHALLQLLENMPIILIIFLLLDLLNML